MTSHTDIFRAAWAMQFRSPILVAEDRGPGWCSVRLSHPNGSLAAVATTADEARAALLGMLAPVKS